jgi:hypothetical protein
MRFYVRTGRRSGISVGIVGAFILGLLLYALAAMAVYVLLFAAAVIVLAGVLAIVYRGGRWPARRRR